MAGHIERQSSTYRQGLVLGLTMAEIMLLLVFCLLLGTGAALTRERSLRDDALRARDSAERRAITKQDELERVQTQLHSVEEIGKKLENQPHIAKIIESFLDRPHPDEYWRRLVESDAVAKALEDQGVSRVEVKEGAEFVARAFALRRSGVDVLNSRGHQWPPIIRLSEADGYFFDSGSAQLAVDFADKLKSSIAPQLVELIKQYNVNVVEVVGHTDEQPIGQRPSNLDRELPSVLKGAAGIATLKPADNAGLGLARAIAVVGVLIQNSELRKSRILPLSGAQLIKLDETLTDGVAQGDVRERRRIEIRLRRAT